MEVLRACRFGFAGGCVKKLKTMVILGLSDSVKV